MAGNIFRRRRAVLFFSAACLLSLLFGPFASTASADSWNAALTSVDRIYDGKTALETLIKLEKQETQALRKRNDEDLKAINAAVKNIDKGKIDQLKAAADQAVAKHTPLLNEYTNLGKQITAAKKNKDKKTADLLELKRGKLKPAQEAARLEIKNKKAALTAAKQAAAAKAKLVKDALAPVTVSRKQITEENKLIAAANKKRSAADKLYKAAVKQGNAITAATQIALIYNELGKIHASQQKIRNWEKQVTAALNTARAKLPKSV